MYLKCRKRKKDGKEHRYWSVVESVRTKQGVSKRQVLYLGEINDAQRAQWCSALEVLDGKDGSHCQMSLFPSDRKPPKEIANAVQVDLNRMELHRPRQWGACWLALELWEQLRLDGFWGPLLPPSRKGTEWLNVLKTLVCYRWIDPGSEWRLDTEWFKNTAMKDLLLKLGSAKKDAGKAWNLVDIELPEVEEAVSPPTFNFSLNRKKLRKTRRGEGTYLLRTNLTASEPEALWRQYMILTEIEQAFKELKHDLAIRPIYHQKDDRIEAHIFVSFIN